MSWRLSTTSARSTRAVARDLGASLEPGTVLALNGDLGAGKTTFVQGLAEGLDVIEGSQVLSPTYTLVNEYPGSRVTLVHIDFYRLDCADAARALGIDEQVLRRDAVVAIEWAERLPELLPPSTVTIYIELGAGDARTLEVTGIERP